VSDEKMGIQHEETLECPCPCHASGGTCAMCASMEGGAARKVPSDPVEMAAMIWQKAFFKAHLEFMAEKLKKKIEAAWGPTSDKAADAMIERMGSQWGAMIQQAKAEQTFREKLTKLYSEGEKKQ
jgi:hypothetical protein